MFIFSVRASSVKFFGIIALTLLTLVALMLGGGTVFASAETADFSGIRTEADRIAFLKDFGIEVAEGGAEECEFVMPKDFDRVMLGYNELQRSQGLDLAKYARKKVTRYTYTMTNYPDYEGTVNATLLVYRNRVIGCDVSSADPEGFVKPLTAWKQTAN